jgi:hypothetical protein
LARWRQTNPRRGPWAAALTKAGLRRSHILEKSSDASFEMIRVFKERCVRL